MSATVQGHWRPRSRSLEPQKKIFSKLVESLLFFPPMKLKACTARMPEKGAANRELPAAGISAARMEMWNALDEKGSSGFLSHCNILKLLLLQNS